METIIKIPLVNQQADTGHVYWAPRTCGLCSLKMVMVSQKPELAGISVMKLVDKALSVSGYLNGIGWKHQVLVDVAKEYGVEMDFAKIFFKTPEQKSEGLKIIDQNITDQKPVIVSIYYKLDPQNGGHMVVIRGYKKKGPETGEIEGYFIQDPDGSYNGHNYFLALDQFLANWRGGMLWLK